MTSIRSCGLAALAALAMTAVALPAAAQATEDKTPDKAADQTAPATAANGVIGAPTDGKGQVVFFRPSRFVGAAVSFSVHEGDKGVGKLGNGSYFVLAADPGAHDYSIQMEAKDTLHMEVEAGETYYVQETIGMGVVAARPHLTPSDKATFDEQHGLKLSTKKATDLKGSADKTDGAEKADK
ncbi:MAG: DUF2846 domain-containing protein [Caulobacterales bacterium]|nr:DUF2846 domain-containing protein [Caulobacterales bacterium]